MSGEIRRYHGSCHCERVRFTAEIDLSRGTMKCNCTACWKRRQWSARVELGAFEALAGDEHLSDGAKGGFCRVCGVTTYSIVDTTGWPGASGGVQVTVNLAALDDLDVATLLAAPVAYLDGLGDAWWQSPAETRHL